MSMTTKRRLDHIRVRLLTVTRRRRLRREALRLASDPVDREEATRLLHEMEQLREW